ncbi:hypothetical protein M0P65_01375 [Candidatus Gracilibacteria bacterium]|nr:hypothetical protein [Candidatus Gracilibacteria bacterium]
MRTLLKRLVSKIGNGLLVSIGFTLGIGIIGLVYAYTWTIQTDVGAGSGLTASAWNDTLNNIRYLKESVDSKVSSQWITSGSNISYNGGNVGIGITPTSKLQVNGDLKVGGQIYGRISNEWELKNIFAGACLAGGTTGGRFITVTTTSGQNCNTACQNSVSSASCVWGITFWAWSGFYGYNYECSTGVNYQQGSSGYICCCSQGVSAIYPIR